MAFLESVIAAVPYKIHTVLTDNGVQFTFSPSDADDSRARYATHMFDMRRQKNGIEHRLTKINGMPWTAFGRPRRIQALNSPHQNW